MNKKNISSYKPTPYDFSKFDNIQTDNNDTSDVIEEGLVYTQELEQIDNNLKRKRSEDYVYPNKKIRLNKVRSIKRKLEGGNVYLNKIIRVRNNCDFVFSF